MPSTHDSASRPVVVVTGMGIVTSLGADKNENWRSLIAGKSGIKNITRFETDGLKTRFAGTVDFVPVEPFCSTALAERLADMVAEEAIAQASIGAKGDFPGPLFLAVAPVEVEWPHREAITAELRSNDAITYGDILRTTTSGRFRAFHERCLFGSNFPIEKLWTSYRELVDAFRTATASLRCDERSAIFATTAARVYRLAP